MTVGVQGLVSPPVTRETLDPEPLTLGIAEQVGWSLRSRSSKRDRGGKSELHRAGCWLTARRGDPTESATETIPPIRFSSRMGTSWR